MQGPIGRKLAQNIVGVPWYKYINKDDNEVGEKGMAHLSKAEWG